MTEPDTWADPFPAEWDRPACAWRPIATAPRDGTAILVGRDGGPTEWHTQLGAWCAAESRWICSSSTWFRDPTHWAPIPEPPHG